MEEAIEGSTRSPRHRALPPGMFLAVAMLAPFLVMGAMIWRLSDAQQSQIDQMQIEIRRLIAAIPGDA